MKIIVVALLLALFSCQKDDSFSYREWRAGDVSNSNAVLKSIQTENFGSATKYKNKKITFFRQTINGKPVFNSFIKKITSNTSDVELIQAQVAEEKYLTAVKYDDISITDFVLSLKAVQNSFSKIEILSIENSYVIERKTAANYSIVSFFDRLGVPYQAFFKPDGSFKRVVRVGSQFSDISTSVFTDGPKFSQLTDQILKGVKANPTLSNALVYVTSESDKK